MPVTAPPLPACPSPSPGPSPCPRMVLSSLTFVNKVTLPSPPFVFPGPFPGPGPGPGPSPYERCVMYERGRLGGMGLCEGVCEGVFGYIIDRVCFS